MSQSQSFQQGKIAVSPQKTPETQDVTDDAEATQVARGSQNDGKAKSRVHKISFTSGLSLLNP